MNRMNIIKHSNSQEARNIGYKHKISQIIINKTKQKTAEGIMQLLINHWIKELEAFVMLMWSLYRWLAYSQQHSPNQLGRAQIYCFDIMKLI